MVGRIHLNNQIDAGDYNIWRAHFGQTAADGSFASGNVPEPATAVMLMFAAGGSCLRRRRAA